MTKNGIILVVLLVILGAIYAVFFTDWFHKQYIQIVPQIRPRGQRVQQRDPTAAQAMPVTFMLRGNFRLTSLKVVAADDLATNKHPTPLWHLISDSNSVPTKVIQYGVRPTGMKPAVPRARPEPLQPDVSYMLILEAGKAKGQTNFHTRELVTSP
jgi:hypothetical protein